MFVVFEGIDGSGKTTISNRVAERLRALGASVKHLRAEGKFASSVSNAIRELGRDARNLELDPKTEFFLYVARDVQLIEENLKPALTENDVVLADRFLFTADVLGRSGRGLPAEFTEPVLKAARGGLAPDLVVLVDVDPVLARARRKSHKIAAADRRPPSRKGLSGVGLQHRLRQGYLELARREPECWVVLDNEDSLEDAIARVVELVQSARTDGVPSALERFRAVSSRRAAASRGAFESEEQALAAFLDWIDRRMEREPRVAAYMLSGLHGTDVDERRRRLAERVPEAVLAAAASLEDDLSWELRNRFQAEHPRAVARTLGGISCSEPRALALRAALEAVVPLDVAASLGRLDEESAWRTRERLYAAHPHTIVATLGGLDGERAWQLRERWLAEHGAELETDYERARALAQSVSGVAGDRAWELRQRARAAAPVSALGSIARLTDAESWRWRRAYLALAPKVVMETLKGLAGPPAWELRRAVVARCKEAIDSIQGLNAPDAWQLREAEADNWPSTVVKSLGILSRSERGRALVARQLHAHSGNVSLLKHVTAGMLGIHRPVFEN